MATKKREERMARIVSHISKATGQSLTLEAYSPGDGWTRYRLAVGGPHEGLSTSEWGGDWRRLSEIEAFLDGAGRAVDAMVRKAGA